MTKLIKLHLVTILLLLPLTLPICAMQNSPNGFNGIKWGTQPDQIKNLTLVDQNGDEHIYIRQTDPTTYGEAAIRQTVYTFHPTHGLHTIILDAQPKNYYQMEQTFFQKFGKADSGVKHNWQWHDQNNLIMLQHNQTEDATFAILINMTTLQKIENLKKTPQK